MSEEYYPGDGLGALEYRGEIGEPLSCSEYSAGYAGRKVLKQSWIRCSSLGKQKLRREKKKKMHSTCEMPKSGSFYNVNWKRLIS